MLNNHPYDQNSTPSVSTIPKYRIGAVSRLTGLSADVVRVWERRYAAIKPQRSDGGSRLYSDDDISRLRKLRQAVGMGHAIGQVANIVSPLLEEIGNRWAHQEYGIAHEHVATYLIRNLLSSLFRLYPPDETAETIVFTTPAGERHEFGILIGALVAATRGWRVVYLGTDLPALEIVRTVKLVKARILVQSLITSSAVTSEELHIIAEQVPRQTRVWAGGSGAPERKAKKSSI